MLKPFYNKKKNIDDRLLPAVTAEDAGKVFIVDANGKIRAGLTQKYFIDPNATGAGLTGLTFSKIEGFFENGTVLFVYVSYTSGSKDVYLISHLSIENGNFGYLGGIGSRGNILYETYDGGETWAMGH